MKLLKILSAVLFIASLAVFALVLVLVVSGFPAPEWLHWHKLKSIRKPFQIFLGLLLAAILIHPDRNKKLESIKNALAHPSSIWILTGVYVLMFLWQQIADYLAIEINFIPFGFYDYMLHYFYQGKLHYTGLLHGFYHINNAMLLLAPAWYFVKSSMFLVVSYPFILAGAAVPLFFLARRYFTNSAVPFVMAFVYLNFRYIQGLLEINFVVEAFYPLFIFSLVYFAVSQKWIWYALFLLLTLSVKEDAPFYLAVLGFLFLWMRGKRIAGLAALVASVAYFYWIHYVLVAWTGSTIFAADAENFRKFGSTPLEIIGYVAVHFPEMIREFFGSKEAIKTLTKIFGNLMFLPVLSPYALMVLTAVFPPFIRGGESFTNLQFQYSAPVIAFLFPALVDALRRIWKRLEMIPKWREGLFSILLVVLVFLNGGNYRTPRLDRDDLKTITLAKSIPVDAVLVTHGHLLPYIGYRKYNFYFQQPMEVPGHPDKPVYDQADYYLLARGVNLFPMDEGFFEKKLAELKARKDLELVQDDGTRYLFKKIKFPS